LPCRAAADKAASELYGKLIIKGVQLDARGKLNWEEVFLDGSFASAKKGGSAWVKPNVARA
jgi:hypothetical protein